MAMSSIVVIPADARRRWAAVCLPRSTEHERAAVALQALGDFEDAGKTVGLSDSLRTLSHMVRQVIASSDGVTHREETETLAKSK